MSSVPVTTPTDPPSPSPRRIATPRWFDLRLVIGVLLVLASVVIGARIVSGAGTTYGVVAVDRDLSAGKVLTTSDLRTAQVRLPDRGRGVYVLSLEQAVGHTLRRDVARGELLPLDALGGGVPGTTLTVPLASGAAPDLRAGNRIELFLSTSACASVVLLPSVTVQSVRTDSGGSFGSGGSGQDVVVSVPSDLAPRIVSALAIDQAQVRAGVLGDLPTSSPSPSQSSPSPSPSQSSPSQSSPSQSSPSPTGSADPSLPDISSCASAAPGK